MFNSQFQRYRVNDLVFDVFFFAYNTSTTTPDNMGASHKFLNVFYAPILFLVKFLIFGDWFQFSRLFYLNFR